jgi:predicted ATPase
MAVGSGGQILISNSTAELARDGLTESCALRDLGEHRLKDLARLEHIFQLVHPSLPSDFPPIKTLNAIPNNLPVQLTSFIGREKEITEIVSLLHSARLVTLTGSGGTGKTRLAQEVGIQMLAGFPQGVWLIELAPLADPSLILSALAQVFGLQERPGNPLEAMIVDYLRAKKALLILDNCEHLIEACAHLADNLLHQCSQLKIIASSREALGIPGEISYRIPSLANHEAVQLFLERAYAANPKFHPSESNTAAIVQVCSRLDGIPLAIELAAARVKMLSPEQIAERLSDRFRLLIGGSRTALPRQQTLRALIDWSYDLLSEEEKRLLCIAAVFVGGWRLDAIESVSGGPGTMEHLEQLVNKSLVVAENGEREMRYGLLETVRQYTLEKLIGRGVEETVRIRSRHMQYFVSQVEAAEPRLRGPDMIECLDELEAEQDNLRAAVEWAIHHDPYTALRIMVASVAFWGRRLSPTEGYNLVRAALAKASNEDVGRPYLAVKAAAHFCEASLIFQLGDNLSAQAAIIESVELARQAKALQILVDALGIGVTIFGFAGNVEAARAWGEECNGLAQKHGLVFEQAIYAGTKIFLAVLSNQPVPPEDVAETLHVSRASGNPWAIAMAYTNIGRLAMYQGQYEEAQKLLVEAEAIFVKMRDRAFYTTCRSELGHLSRKQGLVSEAMKMYRETILSFQEIGQHAAVAHELECIAFIARAQGQCERAVRLLGAAESLRERLNTDMTLIERREYEEERSNLWNQVDQTILERTWAAGRAMTMEQAIAYSLEE